jgi:hypothetical protein
MIDFFYMQQWRRLRETYSERSLLRHEQRLIEVLNRRCKALEGRRMQMAIDLANWEI